MRPLITLAGWLLATGLAIAQAPPVEAPSSVPPPEAASAPTPSPAEAHPVTAVPAPETAAQPTDDDADDAQLTPEERAARRARVAAAQAAASSKPSAPAAPKPERIEFDLQFSPEQGGGSAKGTAGSLEYETSERVVASGGVEVKYQDLVLRAELATVDLATKLVTAEGNVRIDQGARRLSGDRATFDLETKTGNVEHASAYVEPDYYFRGDEIAKTGDNTYTIKHGLFSSCAGEVPAWSFSLSSARLEVDGYAHVKNAAMRIMKVPVLYFPYIVWPVKPDRTSGLLIPNVGYSARRGAYLGLAYFQVLGRSYDDTIYLDLFSKSYYALGNEFRYRPSDGTSGNVKAYAVDDPVSDEVKWKLQWDHRSDDLFRGMRAVIGYREYSDFAFFQDFERDFDINTSRFLYSSAYLSGNWGPQSLNILIDSRETFVNASTTISQRQLPEIEYRLRPRKIGRSPFYLDLKSSVSYLDVDRGANRGVEVKGSYGRVDVSPQVTLPVRAFPWLSLSVAAGGRATWYGDTTASTGNGFAGESLTRTYPVASADVVGPSFSRIFDAKVGPYDKFKHVVEPRFSYDFLGSFDDQSKVPLFDEVDSFQSLSLGRVSLTNRLLGKPSDPKKGSAREVLSLELAQFYSFDDKQPGQISRDGQTLSSWSPVTANLRFTPTDLLNVQTRVSYNTLFSRIDSTSLSANWRLGQSNAGLTWFTRWDSETGDTRSDQIRVNGSVPLIARKLTVNAQVAYDIEAAFLQQQRYQIDYNAKCWGLRLEYREFSATDRNERDWRFAITLKNVGTFLDMNGGDRSGSGTSF